MSYKTFESDENGRLIICPSLYPPRDKGILNLLRKLIRLASPENVKDRSGDRDEQQ